MKRLARWYRRLRGWARRWRARPARPDAAARGAWGEALAARRLADDGCVILGRNVRFGPRDELDLVVRDGQVLVFVEVKTRQSEDYGAPVAAVDRAKRRALSRAAMRYLRALKYRPMYLRFDVVEVVGVPGAPPRAVRWHRNVFNLDARYRLPY